MNGATHIVRVVRGARCPVPSNTSGQATRLVIISGMFYTGETVRCRLLGFGEVMEGGEHPVVQFLGGRRMRLSGDTLKVIPREMYDPEMANRWAWERWLDIRIHGAPQAPVRLMPSPAFDLETAMHRCSQGMRSPVSPSVETGVIYFFSDDEVSGNRTAGEAPVRERRRVRVVATRWPDRDSAT